MSGYVDILNVCPQRVSKPRRVVKHDISCNKRNKATKEKMRAKSNNQQDSIVPHAIFIVASASFFLIVISSVDIALKVAFMSMVVVASVSVSTAFMLMQFSKRLNEIAFEEYKAEVENMKGKDNARNRRRRMLSQQRVNFRRP